MKILRMKSVKIYFVKYFNGFSLHDEEKYFKQYLDNSGLCVAGFSYGAQKALEYTYSSKERIDRLILLSPAFFQSENKSFVRTQLRYFEADKEAYVKQFLKNVSYPSTFDLSKNFTLGNKAELEELLTYKWDSEKIEKILSRGTVIEVFLGSQDKIIKSNDAFDFFSSFTTTYYIKHVGHLLLEE